MAWAIGFAFINEPFAHLDVRNIQLVGNFLKSTRAQYVLTTPITHNVEVFEPADVTLVTSKKAPGARWAPTSVCCNADLNNLWCSHGVAR